MPVFSPVTRYTLLERSGRLCGSKPIMKWEKEEWLKNGSNEKK
jgi:hypothetical protein